MSHIPLVPERVAPWLTLWLPSLERFGTRLVGGLEPGGVVGRLGCEIQIQTAGLQTAPNWGQRAEWGSRVPEGLNKD